MLTDIVIRIDGFARCFLWWFSRPCLTLMLQLHWLRASINMKFYRYSWHFWFLLFGFALFNIPPVSICIFGIADISWFCWILPKTVSIALTAGRYSLFVTPMGRTWLCKRSDLWHCNAQATWWVCFPPLYNLSLNFLSSGYISIFCSFPSFITSLYVIDVRVQLFSLQHSKASCFQDCHVSP